MNKGAYMLVQTSGANWVRLVCRSVAPAALLWRPHSRMSGRCERNALGPNRARLQALYAGVSPAGATGQCRANSVAISRAAFSMAGGTGAAGWACAEPAKASSPIDATAANRAGPGVVFSIPYSFV